MALKLATLAAASCLLAGCFFGKSEGETMRRDVTTLQGQISAKEKALDDQIAQLQKVIDDATKVLKRNNADIGADVDQLRADIRTANGLVTAVNNLINELKIAFDKYRRDNDSRLDTLEQRVGQIESGKPSANSSADELWRLGSAAFDAKRYNDALDIYKRLVQTYPTHAHAPDAQYFRGMSYFNMSDWDHAIGAFTQLVEKYPDSQLADDALLQAAKAAVQMKTCTEARTYLDLIKTKYKKSSNVLKQADDLDKQIKKDLKNKAKCTT
jgi:tol-pal system protein YbgF